MGKCSKSEKKLPKNAVFETSELFSKTKFNSWFGISFVGTMDISSYTQSERPRIAGKYITRLVKNDKQVQINDQISFKY